MRQITIAIDPRHVACMKLASIERIKAVEKEAAIFILARAGKIDAVRRIVSWDETAMRLRLVERQNEAVLRATA